CEHEPDLHRLKLSVSSLLRGDLSVLEAEFVPMTFNSTRSAKCKEYRYTMLHRDCPPVLDRGRVWHLAGKLDVEKMKCEAGALVGVHDFTSFRGTGCSSNTPVKEILESELLQEGAYLVYRVVGKGFLKHMVRNIVGTLVGLGRGELGISSVA